MKFERLEHTDEGHEQRDEPALGASAGVYLLEGGYHVAPFGGGTEVRLRSRGAVLVAALHFQPAIAEIALGGGVRAGVPPLHLAPLRAPRDLPRLPGASGPN